MRYANDILQELETKRERTDFQCQTCLEVNAHSSLKQVPLEMPAINAGALLGEKLECT